MKLVIAAACAILSSCATDYVHRPVTGQAALDIYNKSQAEAQQALAAAAYNNEQPEQQTQYVPVYTQPEQTEAPAYTPHMLFGPNGQTWVGGTDANGNTMMFGPNGQTVIGR